MCSLEPIDQGPGSCGSVRLRMTCHSWLYAPQKHATQVRDSRFMQWLYKHPLFALHIFTLCTACAWHNSKPVMKCEALRPTSRLYPLYTPVWLDIRCTVFERDEVSCFNMMPGTGNLFSRFPLPQKLHHHVFMSGTITSPCRTCAGNKLLHMLVCSAYKHGSAYTPCSLPDVMS